MASWAEAAIAAAAAIAVAGCTVAPIPAPGSLQAAYVVLASSPSVGTVALARVILDSGQPCPSLGTRAGEVPMVARRNPDLDKFPVTVGEAVQPFGEAVRLTGLGVLLPAVRQEPTRIAVLGDTGCGTWQNCDDPAAWPFGRLAEAIGRDEPDLVVHVGDYVYRGTPGIIEVNCIKRGTYNAGNYRPDDTYCQLRDPYVSQNGAGSSLPDSWEAWRIDFFEPAAPLLRRAPLVPTRGNHELCSRAGPGFFYFLDPRSSLLADELSRPGTGQPASA